jgi:hypothetical protein
MGAIGTFSAVVRHRCSDYGQTGCIDPRRLRRHLVHALRQAHVRGCIPGYAGAPTVHAIAVKGMGVHPRVCGGTHRAGGDQPAHRGPSPRMRGHPSPSAFEDRAQRSIPAYAGAPLMTALPGWAEGVHPRVCGGTGWQLFDGRVVPGPSPRMRGHREPTNCNGKPTGSIPAYAGAPSVRASAISWARVHPRVCGGTLNGCRDHQPRTGPSPRMRGHPKIALERQKMTGSIPAYAGAPSDQAGSGARGRVHPRVCGGTSAGSATRRLMTGPSPRMRGHPRGPGGRWLERRSIPAYAGAPSPRPPHSCCRRVHPRVCANSDIARPLIPR